MIEFHLNKNKIQLKSDYFNSIRDFFSIPDETARFRMRGRSRYTSSRVYCITPTGLFEPGLFYDILRYTKEAYPNEQLYIDPNITGVVKPGFKDVRLYDNLKLPLRDYQIDACNNALNYGRGIIKMGTGAGKTLTICSLLMSAFIKFGNTFKCLLIVPDLSLVNQTYNDFQSYNALFKYTRWTGKLKPDLTANIIIANLGILQSQFNNNPWLEDIHMVVIDECHKLKKGNKVNKIVQSIKTYHKFGLTGTLPDNKPDEWNIIGKLGHVIYEKDSYSLRLEQHLTPVKASILNVSYKNQPLYRKDCNNYKLELDFIYENTFRNSLIKQICINFTNNILILVNHILHGDKLLNSLEEIKDKQVYFIRGEVEVEERDRIKQLMETEKNVICIAISAIFSTGINIKNIHMIIFAAGGKSSIRTIQSIGRGLRLHETKERLQIIDVADNLKFGKNHIIKRRDIYTQEKIPFQNTNIVEK